MQAAGGFASVWAEVYALWLEAPVVQVPMVPGDLEAAFRLGQRDGFQEASRWALEAIDHPGARRSVPLDQMVSSACMTDTVEAIGVTARRLLRDARDYHRYLVDRSGFCAAHCAGCVSAWREAAIRLLEVSARPATDLADLPGSSRRDGGELLGCPYCSQGRFSPQCHLGCLPLPGRVREPLTSYLTSNGRGRPPRIADALHLAIDDRLQDVPGIGPKLAHRIWWSLRATGLPTPNTP